MAKKILIITNDAFVSDIASQKLQAEGFAITTSKDGREGFDDISSLMPDLVILDMDTPTMSGFEILEAKGKKADIAAIPVVVISAAGDLAEVRKVVSLGAKDYLVKAQLTAEEVLVKVKAHIAGGSAKAMAETISLKDKKIMWVEDDQFLSDLISRKLAAQGCKLIYAATGEDALKKLETEKPDLILLDILLPGINGFEVLEKIKADQRLKAIPVIILSNLAQKSEIDRGKSLGADRFLIKATLILDQVVNEIKTVAKEHNIV
ncbi:response regulator [Candidatus Parcubacteria bacterium]|nr:response regulator [Candidatus Parcubacteria bacterium]